VRLNVFKSKPRPRTHEGAPARVITPEQMLRRTVLSCMLWEGEFYEDGVQIAGRIHELVPQVAAETVAALAVEARERMKLRHAPLLLVREMARHASHRPLVAETLTRVIQRADELSEFVAIYWAGGRQPLSAQVKKGLGAAFGKFDEYALAKYDRAGAVRLRDVLFLCHARPVDEAQAALWKRLAENELATSDTWEVALSASGRGEGTDKREIWERLLTEQAGRAGSLAEPAQPAHCQRQRGNRARRSCGSQNGPRAAVPLSGCCTQRSAVGRGTGSSHVPRAGRQYGKAGRAHGAAGGCLRLHGGGHLQPL
jgi:60 kDa SS-A/Ro ribonucleoprotein